VLSDAEAKARLEAAGLEVLGGPPERLARHLREELTRHGELVRRSGVRID
jgi:tripartite-type tricarboxylate transporter receptor subunit TctC